ncbi:MAG TPA: DUF1877 family protein [Mycobacterium sp.]
MPIICRLLGLRADAAAALKTDPTTLPSHVADCDRHTELYWYWHGIDYLLSQAEAPAAVHCLRVGGIELSRPADLPPTRLHLPVPLQQAAAALNEVAPEALFAGYDPATMDAAHIYPERWSALAGQHDIISDLLEHYAHLQEFAVNRAAEDRAMLVLYERREDETGF